MRNGGVVGWWGVQSEETMIRSFKELDVWNNAIAAAMDIFHRSKRFPADERYSLTDQIRRSSRSVAAQIAEAWRKRRYPASFISKLNDAEAEAAETQTWIVVAHQCAYLSSEEAQSLEGRYDQILGQLVRMSNDSDRCAPRYAKSRISHSPPPQLPISQSPQTTGHCEQYPDLCPRRPPGDRPPFIASTSFPAPR